ncbi:hypothetical protein [uncultured Roseibium sp.]|nr:hypothetical protein [uncultured Roseibium sp.]
MSCKRCERLEHDVTDLRRIVRNLSIVLGLLALTQLAMHLL